MERLTEKVFGFVQLKACGNDFCKETCTEHDEENSCENSHIQKAFEKLAEYEDLEDNGLLLRLPVPIGTTVYKFEPSVKETKRYIKTIVTRYDVFEDSIWFTFANGLGRNIEDFGKYVFLTQAEAERKLKEMESD